MHHDSPIDTEVPFTAKGVCRDTNIRRVQRGPGCRNRWSALVRDGLATLHGSGTMVSQRSHRLRIGASQ